MAVSIPNNDQANNAYKFNNTTTVGNVFSLPLKWTLVFGVK